MRMPNPFQDERAERVAIVNALQLFEWLAYTTPPHRTGTAIQMGRKMLANELSIKIEEEAQRVADHKRSRSSGG